MKKALLVSVLALGLSGGAASAAPLELSDAELDGVTAGALIDLNLHVPITIQNVTVTLQDINANAIANLSIVAPVLSSDGTRTVDIRQRGRIRARRR